MTNAIRIRYWAAAKAAAGTDGDELAVDGPVTMAEVVRRATALHPDTRLGEVLAVCSALIGDQPVGSQDPGKTEVSPGSTIEFLPPFAGG